jgi:hypothetical protein
MPLDGAYAHIEEFQSIDAFRLERIRTRSIATVEVQSVSVE